MNHSYLVASPKLPYNSASAQGYYPTQRQSYPYMQNPFPQYAQYPRQMSMQGFMRSPINPNYSVMMSPQSQAIVSPQRRGGPQMPQLPISRGLPIQLAAPAKPVAVPKKTPSGDKIDLNDELQRKYQEAVDKSNELLKKYRQETLFLFMSVAGGIKNEDPTELEELALQYEDGFIYRGQGIAPQTREGYGVLTDPTENEVYAGNWSNNVYNGEGKLTNLEEDENDHDEQDYHDLSSIGNAWKSYEGEFSGGKMNGKGTLSFKNGEQFEGEFHEGAITGQGIFYSLNEKPIGGLWEDGILKSYKKHD